MAFMFSKNCSRLLFRPCFSKLPWLANVVCRIVLPLTTLFNQAVDLGLVQRFLKL